MLQGSRARNLRLRAQRALTFPQAKGTKAPKIHGFLFWFPFEPTHLFVSNYKTQTAQKGESNTVRQLCAVFLEPNVTKSSVTIHNPPGLLISAVANELFPLLSPKQGVSPHVATGALLVGFTVGLVFMRLAARGWLNSAASFGRHVSHGISQKRASSKKTTAPSCWFSWWFPQKPT